MVLYLIYLDAKSLANLKAINGSYCTSICPRNELLSRAVFVSAGGYLGVKRLNYSSVNKLSRTGQYVKSANIKVYRREFEFYDGLEDAHVIKLRFSGQKLATIKDKFGRRLNNARLEPVQIARIGNDQNKTASLYRLINFRRC